jgi:hypothetical protein
MKRLYIALAILAAALSPLAAWDNHSQLSYLALEGESLAATKVKAESLGDFALATQPELADLLSRLEAEARKDIPLYPARPDALAFEGPYENADAARAAFMAAIRVNPSVPFALYVQLQAGATRPARPDLSVAAADPFDNRVPNGPFQSLSPGEEVDALEVVASASDEPDYGMDIGLFSDNKSPVASTYGFGIQAFGNPALAYGSQAPFHMAFASESGILKAAAPFTRVALSDWRFRLYSELSRFAFAEGHAYWGWRFAGWALHYLQDMAQPYHASVMPGKSTMGMLWLYAVQGQKARDDALVLLSNRHVVVEDYVYGAMAAYDGDAAASPLYSALKAGGPGLSSRELSALTWRPGYLYGVVAKRAYAEGRRLDALLVSSFPAAYVSDPAFDYGVLNAGPKAAYKPWAALHAAAPDKAAALDAFMARILAEVGVETRVFIEWLAAK